MGVRHLRRRVLKFGLCSKTTACHDDIQLHVYTRVQSDMFIQEKERSL